MKNIINDDQAHMKSITPKKKVLYKLTIWSALFISIFILWRLSNNILVARNYVPIDDYVRFWASGRLLSAGENPYSLELILQIQNKATAPIITTELHGAVFNPPWVIVLFVPFGFLDYPTSRLLWLLASVAILILCTNITWKIYKGPEKLRWLAWIIGFTFGPAISILEKGQITLWILLGIIGFIYFLEFKPNDWLAGISMALISFKPQIFYLFWPIVLLWIIKRRRWKIAAGCILTIVGMTFLALVINPQIIENYLQALMTNPPSDWATPTIGGYLRLIFGINLLWLQFLPVIAGLAWSLIYWYRYHDIWIWHLNVSPILFVSILTTAYAWTYDQVILIIPVLLAIKEIIEKGSRAATFWAVFALSFIDLIDLVLHRRLDEFWFGWLAPALWIWYLIIQATTSKGQTGITIPTPQE